MDKEALKKRISLEYGFAVRASEEPDGDFPVFGSNGPIGYIDSYKVKGPGVVVGRKGSVGTVTYSDKNFTPTDTAYFIKVLDKKKDDLKFWAYFLPLLKLEKLNSHSAVPGLSRELIYLIEPDIPSIDIQNSIVQVLSSIDNRIELNNRINIKLEALAKTLYDYWFIQFDFPDANGNPYKSSGGKMVYNEILKREIPYGWKPKTLSDIANITMGQSPPGKSYNEEGEGSIFFQGSTDFGTLFPTVRQFTNEPSRMAQKKDILLSVRAPVGAMNIAKENCCIGRGLAALNSKTNSNSFLYYVMKYFKQIFDRRNSEGTTFGSITKDDLYSLLLVFPDNDTLKNYDEIVESQNQMIFNLNLENEQLSNLRDWLLPMLMNGQVTVK